MSNDKDYGLGNIKITIRFDEDRSLLFIGIHQANNLINTDKKGLSDPYVRVILLPDEKGVTKKETKVIDNNLNPSWDQTFDYTLTFAEANSRVLHVSVHDKKGLFEKQETTFMGEITVTLANIDIKKGVTEWYNLKPHSTFAATLATNDLFVKT